MSALEDLPDLQKRTFAPELKIIRQLAAQPDPSAALLQAIEDWQAEAKEWTTTVDALAKNLETTRGPNERRAFLTAWLRRTSSLATLPGDLAALNRNLGLDAIRERATAHRDHLGCKTALALAALVDSLKTDPARHEAAGARMRRTLRTHDRPGTRRQAVDSLVALLGFEPYAPWSGAVRRELMETAIQDRDVWVRRRAVGVMRFLDADTQESLWSQLGGPEHALTREAALHPLAGVGAWGAIAQAIDDPTELVRFKAIALAVHHQRQDVWHRGITHAELRTRAWLASRLGLDQADSLARLVLDADALVSRFALLACEQAATKGVLPAQLIQASASQLEHVDLGVRRAAQAVVAWQAHHDSPAVSLAHTLSNLGEGERRTVQLPPDVTALDLALALRPYALRGFGFTLRPRGSNVRVTRGDREGHTLWRVLHELRNPAPAKRQGHVHTSGALLEGPIQIPPVGLAEQSATGIPGQRVQVHDGDWGSDVPTPDDYRRALRWGSSMVVSSAGVLSVERPSRLIDRIRARWRLLWGYEQLDQQRRAALEQQHPERFLARTEAMGFQHVHRAVGGFLPYLLSTRGNSLLHLAVLLGLMWTLLLGANFWMRTLIRRWRNKIHLVVGGWGTRGKSGTERIKAGMLQGAGVPFVSKTTGCEAMILHGPRGGRVREIFLFRPYDKATIWEQADVLRFAATVGTRAMIWECMALNPRYVDLLQRGWMRDDLSTLTNAYPDHEDVMGPTGMDVARAIGSFSPRSAKVFTTEATMFPALAAQAQRFGSTATGLSDAEKELIPRELLARFPYEEHPSNIALAARVGEELGLDRVEAIGWMADHVIPDLGALMVYPPVAIEGRTVTFVNGHSANDELSFTHSWRHTGFAAHTTAEHPETWLVGVINNRADRLPRSRVFARLAVRVAGAHRFLLIGTNLSGFATFVEQALTELLAGLELADDGQWAHWCEHAKITDPRSWLYPLLEARGLRLSEDPFRKLQPKPLPEAEAETTTLHASELATIAPDLLPWVIEETTFWLAREASHTEKGRKSLLAERLRRRIIPLPDPGASGDQVVAAAANLAPPGIAIRMMGMQNIKGTGLDFVYQWVRWRTLHSDLKALLPEAIRDFSVKRLTSVFLCDAALETVTTHPNTESLQEQILAKRASLLTARQARPSGGALSRFLRRWAWRAFDPIDAISRRRKARRVLADLAMARISHDDAEQILAALTKRQKS